MSLPAYIVTASAPASDVMDADDPVSNNGYIYFGSKTADGSWRMIVDGVNLKVERRESSAWVTKGVFTP